VIRLEKMKKIIKKIIPETFINWYHFCETLIGAILYGFPGYNKKIKIIGVTGTNGKSTTVYLISKILEETGFKVASFSSVKSKIGEKEEVNMLKMTMPGRFILQEFIKKSIKENCNYIILEVTSEGIKQFRHSFIKFDGAVFTNLTPEHIESHGSFENYKKAKGKLFAISSLNIINLDDKNANFFINQSPKKVIGYTLQKDSKKDFPVISGGKEKVDSNRIRFKVKGVEIEVPILGEFNIMNSLAAITFAFSQKIGVEKCKKALKNIKGIPGRMELIKREPFPVIVDYAHTPDSLEKVYQSTDKLYNKKKICVLGSCGGGRDKWKRDKLGKIANNYCEKVIITNEDPYDEKPIQIINDVAKGVEKEKLLKIENRKEAIAKAIRMANSNNVVIITGKGAEPLMCVANGKKIEWDDREIVKNSFKKLKIKNHYD